MELKYYFITRAININYYNYHLICLSLIIGIKTIGCLSSSSSSSSSSHPTQETHQESKIIEKLSTIDSHIKFKESPILQLDTSTKYYKIFLDNLVNNFKKSIDQAIIENSNYHKNNDKNETIEIKFLNKGDEFSKIIQDLQIDGLDKPKVSNVYVNSKNMKLHVNFNFKTIKVHDNNNNNKILLEATNWNTSWSASLIPMIGRKHFDSNKVYNLHSHQKLNFSNYQSIDKSQEIFNKELELKLINRIKLEIENRLEEIMELIIIKKHNDEIENHENENQFSKSNIKERFKRSFFSFGSRSSKLRNNKPEKLNFKVTISRRSVPTLSLTTKTTATTNKMTKINKTSTTIAPKVKQQKRAAPSTSAKPKKSSPKTSTTPPPPPQATTKKQKKNSSTTTTTTKKPVSKPKEKTKKRSASNNFIKTSTTTSKPNLTTKKVAKQSSINSPAKQQQEETKLNQNQNQNQKPSTTLNVDNIKKQKLKVKTLNVAGAISSNTSSTINSKQKPLKRIKRQGRFTCEPSEDLDEYVDDLLRAGNRMNKQRENSAPNATIELPDYNLQIFLYDGFAFRLNNIQRVKQSWSFCNNETVSIGVTVVARDMLIKYKYRVISGSDRLLFDGDFVAKLSPRVQAQYSEKKQDPDNPEDPQRRVDRLRIFRLGRVFVLIRGLGNLTQSLSLMINSYLNDRQDELQPTFRMMEKDAAVQISKILSKSKLGISLADAFR